MMWVIRRIFFAISMSMLASVSAADHLSDNQCDMYFECVLGIESALNRCYDNAYLASIHQNRVMCMRIAQHNCKVKAGIWGTGKRLTITRPIDLHGRPTLMDLEPGIDQDMEIYNYAGWNHCQPKYRGLEDFWCDPKQLRYPPRPWCDVVPNFPTLSED